MLDSAYKLGKYLLERDNISVEDSILKDAGFTHIIIVQLHGDHTISGYSCDLREYNFQRHNDNYPYIKPPSSGTGIFPASTLIESKKTFSNKIVKWFTKHKQNNDEKVAELFLSTEQYLLNNFEEITNDLTNLVQQNNDRNARILLTIEYLNVDLQQIYMMFIKNNFLTDVYNKYSTKSGSTSKGIAECYYCNKVKEVNGFATPYTFYTHDKITFASQLDVTSTWKQFPVCNECATTVKNGTYYIKKSLSFIFVGLKYYLFPTLLIDNYDDFLKLIEGLHSSEIDEEQRRVRISKSLSNNEKEILADLADENNNLTLTFLFYQMNNAQFEIRKIINNVLPSRLSELFAAKEKIDKNNTYINWWNNIIKNQNDSFTFTYAYLRSIFPKYYKGEQGGSDIYIQQFLELTDVSFTGQSIPTNTLLLPAVRIMQHLFANRKDQIIEFYFFAIKALAVLNFFEIIGCITFKETHHMSELLQQLNINDSKLAETTIEILDSNKYFDHPIKKAAFITGVLTRQVARVQYTSLGSEPFYEKLDGLRLNPRKLKRLFAEAIGKLIEYSENKKQIYSLETLASYYYQQTEITLSNEDISFAFALGLSFGSAIWNYKKTTTGEKNE